MHPTYLNITYGDVSCTPKYYLFSVWDTAIRAVTYTVFDVALPALAGQDTCGLPKGRCRQSINHNFFSGTSAFSVDYEILAELVKTLRPLGDRSMS